MTTPRAILGVSAYYHDSAACLLVDGEIVAAAQEERFSRLKHDPGFPRRSVAYCLNEAGIGLSDLDRIAFYDKPFIKFERLTETYFALAPKGLRSFLAALPVWLKEKLNLKSLLRRELNALGLGEYAGPFLFPEHHVSHAASAFYPSPFDEAAILTVDGVGEYATTTLGFGKDRSLSILKEIDFPHSLGLLYSAFTYFTGFKVNSGEYKLMGLAPYGEPRFADLIRNELIDVKPDGSFRLNLAHFDFLAGDRMTGPTFDALFGRPPRSPESPITPQDMDIAASIQQVTEEVILKLGRTARDLTGSKRLAMAGGVALNCVANGRLLRERIFDDLWIQPAAGDAGGALGAALAAWHLSMGEARTADGRTDRMRGSYLGPSFTDDEIESRLRRYGARGLRYADDAEFLEAVAALLDKGLVVGFFQGRMEFGPRALGHRSILGDARDAGMQKRMNLKIKFRESFRPFAPSVLAESVGEYFSHVRSSPYMLLVDFVRPEHRLPDAPEDAHLFGIDKLNRPRSDVPAITHVDGSARLHTVDRRVSPRYWALIEAFRRRTGTGLLVNTSFNVRGEPIVHSPEDAYRCFMRTDMDALAAGNWLFLRSEQPEYRESSDWKSLITPD